MAIKRILLLVCCFSGLLLGKAATARSVVSLFAEDGSAVIREWVYSGDSDYWKAQDGRNTRVLDALAAEGVSPRPLPLSVDWLQDILFFSDEGVPILNAPYPSSESIFRGEMALHIFNEDGLSIFPTRLAQIFAPVPRRLQWSFLEGGALISGRFLDGKPYVISNLALLQRLQRFIQYRQGLLVTETEARELLALDLAVDPQHLFLIPTLRHLDTFMMALPGGRILLHDLSLVESALRNALTETPFGFDRQMLLEMVEHNRASAEGSRALSDTTTQALKVLQTSFHVERVAGIFLTPAGLGRAAGETTNFFNGFHGRSPRDGEYFQVTNRSHAKALEQHWSREMARLSIRPERIYFAGHYLDGAGLNCAGVPR